MPPAIETRVPDHQFHEGQAVNLIISGQTDLGYKAIIEDSDTGLLYKNEVFQPLRKGQKVSGFIKKLREDGKIDLCLQKPGYERVGEVAEKILELVRKKGGFLPVTDSTPAETIYQLFAVSKKIYKKAVGALYKKRLILIDDKGIRLIS